MMLFVMLLSMLMVLLSILSVISYLICDDNLNWLLNLNLIYETLLAVGRSGLLISINVWKTQMVSIDWSNNIGSIEGKMDGSVLDKKIIF